MWIAFVLCTFGLIYSVGRRPCCVGVVVNCFRSLYLWVDLQPAFVLAHEEKSCELLSFFVPLGWFTAKRSPRSCVPQLWIAFVLCTFGLIYSERLCWLILWAVVNCFRSLYLWVDLQHHVHRVGFDQGCELLSFFVPLGWFTAHRRRRRGLGLLWIAFVLCTFGLIYSPYELAGCSVEVVNCFRSLYLWVDLQPKSPMPQFSIRCELLSFFVPLGWFTADLKPLMSGSPLWIAFVLCTFGLIYSTLPAVISDNVVVNCFRSLYLWVDLQPSMNFITHELGCELLSFFVPLGWFTAHSLQNSMGQRVMNCNWKRKSRPLRAGISLFIIAVR